MTSFVMYAGQSDYLENNLKSVISLNMDIEFTGECAIKYCTTPGGNNIGMGLVAYYIHLQQLAGIHAPVGEKFLLLLPQSKTKRNS